ncbi:unnamed protein product [Bursaphelenchus okinawaensis]|uniref:C2H2-type domain-containing protein n=1 Tax=Bursaphelenchus okinawaensis TaxID=465554 RepID=A0A811JT83_9BILA|nr:unnamed protein product [Bursaphelenchus okinawaensis]CAG9082686.1 unnamed protein product [Bursaphelenchus okinawaensis]
MESLVCSECKSVFSEKSELHEHFAECTVEAFEVINWEKCPTTPDLCDDGECPTTYMEVETSQLHTEDGRLSAMVSLQVPSEWNELNVTELPESVVTMPSANNETPVIIGTEATIDSRTLKSNTKMKCPVCHIMLYRHNYSVHFRIHSGERPYQCFFCEKTFRTTSSRKIHHRVHTGERPYVCQHCSYGAVTKRNLDRHIFNQHTKSQYYTK